MSTLAQPHPKQHGNDKTAGRFVFGRVTIVAEIKYSTEPDYGDDSLIVDAIIPTDMDVKDGHADLTHEDHQIVGEQFGESIMVHFMDRARSLCIEHWSRVQRFGD